MSDKIRTPLLHLDVTPMTAIQVVEYLARSTERPHLILNHNLHSSYLMRTDETFRGLYRHADVTLIDGWPVYALARMRRRISVQNRVGSTDWITALRHTTCPLRIFVLGATDDANIIARNTISSMNALITTAGHHGYFDLSSPEEIIAAIRRFEPDLVLVGMGMPRQEAFLLQNISDLPPAYYATVGGAIDYLSGQVALSPRWMGAVGLEWVWRLAHDPKRLAHRYLVEPMKLARHVLTGQKPF